MKTSMVKPNASQIREVARTLKDELLPRWGLKDIASGIRRVSVSEVGYIHEVFVSPGIFATLCYYQFGNRTRKPFQLNGWRVRQWKP